jgi:hypothetical protein
MAEFRLVFYYNPRPNNVLADVCLFQDIPICNPILPMPNKNLQLLFLPLNNSETFLIWSLPLEPPKSIKKRNPISESTSMIILTYSFKLYKADQTPPLEDILEL